MKLPLLLAFALALTACDKVIFSADPTPVPATPPPPAPAPAVAGKAGAAATPPTSPTPKPGAWMYDSKSGLDKSGKLGAKGKK